MGAGVNGRDKIEVLIAVAVAIAQINYLSPDGMHTLARLWDKLAKVLAFLANVLGWWAMKARENYYLVVNNGT